MPPSQKRQRGPQKHSTKLTTSTNRGTSTTALKKKVRDLERLLDHQTNLPADVRVENERALEAFRHELSLARKSARDEKIDKKYQMVRFFERQKASRKLKQLQKQLADPDAPESLQDDIHTAQVDLNYILHYPKGEKYISLFKDPGEHNQVLEKRDMIRRDIERQMTRGTWRSGRGLAEEGKGEDRNGKKEDKGKKRKEEEGAPEEEEDGFFEF